MRYKTIAILFIVAGAILFLPMVFQGHNLLDRQSYLSERVPTPPKVQDPHKVVNTLLAEADNQQQVLLAENTVSLKNKVTSLFGQSLRTKTISPLQAWVVQLASLRSEQVADRMVNELRQANFAAYMQAIKTDSGVIYRVNVGPVFNRAQAQDLLVKLQNENKQHGIVVAFMA